MSVGTALSQLGDYGKSHVIVYASKLHCPSEVHAKLCFCLAGTSGIKMGKMGHNREILRLSVRGYIHDVHRQ